MAQPSSVNANADSKRPQDHPLQSTEAAATGHGYVDPPDAVDEAMPATGSLALEDLCSSLPLTNEVPEQVAALYGFTALGTTAVLPAQPCPSLPDPSCRSLRREFYPIMRQGVLSQVKDACSMNAS
jgi:hypothetical protein